MERVKHEESATWKIATRRKCNKKICMKTRKHEKSVQWKKCNMKEVQQEKSATRRKCFETRKERNTKKVHHEKSTTWTKYKDRAKLRGKSAKEECTIVHKGITGRPLKERYTLVRKYRWQEIASRTRWKQLWMAWSLNRMFDSFSWNNLPARIKSRYSFERHCLLFEYFWVLLSTFQQALTIGKHERNWTLWYTLLI